MFTQPRLDSTTNEAYGRYQQHPHHERLPKPPRVLKNRYIDQTRHRLRRSNDEYGQFLDQPEVELSGDWKSPAGLTSKESNRHTLPLNRALTDRKGAESVAFWHEPWLNEPDDPSNANAFNNSPPPLSDRRPERKHFDVETLHPMTPAPYREPAAPYRDQPAHYRNPSAPYRESQAHYREPQAPYREPQAPYRGQPAPLPPIARGHSPVGIGRSGDGKREDDLDKFIERYKLHVGIENKGLGTSVRAPDIRYIDLRLHLKDNSSLTIKAVPFSFH